ncbi:DegV family EDD domain-containing protein [Mycoplasma anatis]|uniref:DegV family protein n=1 Tax=Mycoplasmopsis anatis TaxID=171279 RepID=UPI001C4E20DC|nr:DegV family protein [Mycoplasmopsis anatis]MBW0596278.1 DegV family EDD domain-containing protein [Mycoplasmopsis anatis]MBW0597018.1 DegV family EDD domain-containing protein [Mycoplasmopsis anatis]MBW0597310.1 DegV family EDD domain-containing protein [Mycoplasmopsis anatis]MBW0599817.1 DegV family EDD domain-containing protein [Mycoplasmopsis anatis]MBW0600655.1 DegV family EDD domain-containing protein [Mycoplasmopsis anatis]
MKKLGFIIDSFSSLTKEQANSYGFGFLSLQSEIDGEVFQDGLQEPEILLDKIEKANNVLTSLPRLDLLEGEIERMAKSFDEVIILILHESLSSSARYCKTIAQEYTNVHIVSNFFSGDQFVDVALYAQKSFEKNQDIDKVIQEINEINEKSQTYILPVNLDYIIKGGRLTGAKKFIMTKIQMIPLLKYRESVTVSTLKRTTSSLISKTFEKLVKIIGGNEKINDFSFRLIRGLDHKVVELVSQVAKEFGIVLDSIQSTSGAVAIHCGPSAFSISVMPKLNKK